MKRFETLIEAQHGRLLRLPPRIARLYGRFRLPASRRPYVIGNFVSTLDGIVSLGEKGHASGGDISGFSIEDRWLKRAGLDFVCVSSGGTVSHQKIPVTPGYQVPFAEQVRKEAGVKTRAVGMIADLAQAEDILASGKADMVAMARAFLDNPRWVWHAAERFGVSLDYPPQYARSRHDAWPGAKLARPARQ